MFFGGGGVGLQIGGNATGAGFAGGGAGNVGGFLGILQARQQVRNAEQNLAAQERALALLEANLEAGLVGLEQVDQLRQSIETNRAGLLQAKTSLTNQLENFKVNVLCIPSDTAVALDEEFMERFQFISPEMEALQNDLGDFLATYSFGSEETLREVEDPRQDQPETADSTGSPSDSPVAAGAPELLPAPRPAGQADEAAASDGANPESLDEQGVDRSLVTAALAALDGMRERVVAQATEVESDLERAATAAAGRLAAMRATERDTFRRDMRLLATDLARLLGEIRRAEDEIERIGAGLTADTLRESADAVARLVGQVSSAVDEMSLIQARARVEAITVVPERLDPDLAFEIARANRLDWMNNRAALVDQWRLIQYNAMSLLAGLDVEIAGDLRTTGNNPARFRAPTGSMGASLRFDAPLTRLIERNNFRQAIVDYQQVRRQQIQFEDRIKLSIRQSLRQLELDERNLETQRRAVIIAIRRVDQTRLTLSQPAAPPPLPGPDGTVTAEPQSAQFSPTATLNLIYAFNDLRSSQDALTSIWINYYATRAALSQQLGVMELSDDGLWIDKPFAQAERAGPDEMPLPPPVPQEWLDHLEEIGTPPPVPPDFDLEEAARERKPWWTALGEDGILR